MMSGVLSPMFLQSAGRAGKEQNNKIILKFTNDNPILAEVNCDGEIKVESTKSGQRIVATYSNLEDSTVSIQADANTEIKITGNVNGLAIFGEGNTQDLASYDFSRCYSLILLDMEDLGINEFDATRIPSIERLSLLNCADLEKIILPNSLVYFSATGSESLKEIKYAATNEDVSTAIADAITNATAADGTVDTDSEGAYYSTIADAATAKGWTIEQIA